MQNRAPVQASPAKPIIDISYRALQVARLIDRLRPGTYTLRITKDDIPAKDWGVVVEKSETLKKISLARRDFVAE